MLLTCVHEEQQQQQEQEQELEAVLDLKKTWQPQEPLLPYQTRGRKKETCLSRPPSKFIKDPWLQNETSRKEVRFPADVYAAF